MWRIFPRKSLVLLVGLAAVLAPRPLLSGSIGEQFRISGQNCQQGPAVGQTATCPNSHSKPPKPTIVDPNAVQPAAAFGGGAQRQSSPPGVVLLPALRDPKDIGNALVPAPKDSNSNGTAGIAAPAVPPSVPSTFSPPPTQVQTTPAATPGGILLSKAAAQGLAIKLNLDGAYYDDGQLVLSGKAGAGFDAALLVTALRAACEKRDPYFSLDPDEGGAWVTEANQAADRFWETVQNRLGWSGALRPAGRSPIVSQSRTILANREFPREWNAIAAQYPHLRSKLVFEPAWLAQTRFGEIMYKADVLLKELAAGTPVLESGPLRAARVPGYVSQLNRSNSRNLSSSLAGQHRLEAGTRTSRLWFDIAPEDVSKKYRTEQLEKEGYRVLPEAAEFIDPEDARQRAAPSRAVIRDEGALDVSQLFPTMFVRRHDFAAGADLPGNDPILRDLSLSINDNMEKYVSQYHELRALTDLVRTYIIAVHVISKRSDPNSFCSNLSSKPLLESEKAKDAEPEYIPSLLALAITKLARREGNWIRTYRVQARTIQGGVTVAGKAFYAESLTGAASPLTKLLHAEVPKLASSDFADRSGRHFIAFNIDDYTSVDAAEATPDKEPLPGTNPATHRDDGSSTTYYPEGLALEGAPEAKAVKASHLDPSSHVPHEAYSPIVRHEVPRPKTQTPYEGTGAGVDGRAVGLIISIAVSLVWWVARLAHADAAPRKVHGVGNVISAAGRYPNGAFAMPDLSEIPSSAASDRTQSPTENAPNVVDLAASNAQKRRPQARSSAQAFTQRNASTKRLSEIETRFNSIYFNLNTGGRQRIIDYWSAKRSCGYLDAMAYAIEDWEKDQRASL